MEKKGIIDKITSCKLDATAVAGLAAFICGVDIWWPIAPIAMAYRWERVRYLRPERQVVFPRLP
jgi:hypothetical protein